MHGNKRTGLDNAPGTLVSVGWVSTLLSKFKLSTPSTNLLSDKTDNLLLVWFNSASLAVVEAKRHSLEVVRVYKGEERTHLASHIMLVRIRLTWWFSGHFFCYLTLWIFFFSRSKITDVVATIVGTLDDTTRTVVVSFFSASWCRLHI